MTSPAAPPLSRPVLVVRLPPEGLDVTVEASEAEREALAREIGLPALHALAARFHLAAKGEAVRVTGRIRASIEQVCVVSLDPFGSEIDEEVSLDFVSPEAAAEAARPMADLDAEHDLPEEIVDGRIDLGHVTAEFLALGLDPYPRKPGIAFESPTEADGTDSPFASLAGLARRD